MNLRLKDRIGLAVYSLCGMGAAVLTGYLGYLLFTGRVSVRVPLLGYVGSVFGSFAVAIIMLVYSLCMLRLALRRKSKKDRNSVAVQNTQQGNGEVRVSLQALDALVKQAIAGNSEGVADIKTSIVNHDDSISVKIEMGLHGDAHIPNITMLLQGTIKSFIEEYSGIAVRDVSIMVKTIIPVMPQLAIEKKEPVVIEAEEQENLAAPQVQVLEESVESEEVPMPKEETEELSCEEEAAAEEETVQTEETPECEAEEEQYETQAEA